MTGEEAPGQYQTDCVASGVLPGKAGATCSCSTAWMRAFLFHHAQPRMTSPPGSTI